MFSTKLKSLGIAALAAFAIIANQASGQTYTNAYDVAANYSSFSGNQGYGFGSWVLSTPGGGEYISGDTPHLFGIWNGNANAQSTAVRTFNSPLPVGGSFWVQLELNNLDTTLNTNALQLQDANSNVLFSYFHEGGDTTNGWYTDANGTGVANGFPYDYGLVDSFKFTLTGSHSYTFTDITTGNSFSGTLSGAPITQVTFLRANGNYKPGNGQDFKFNALTITSSNNPAPFFTLQPQNQWGLGGSTITLTSMGSSTQPLNYRWYYNNAPLSGATSSNLVLANVGATNEGTYYVTISNSLGTATSLSAVVSVVPFGYTNAFDAASNYTVFTGNEGFGFGPWQLNTSGGGDYISSDTPPLFGIWNNTADAASTALRPFNVALSTNNSFLFQFENTTLDTTGNTNAIELMDASSNVIFSYFQVGTDSSNGWFTDANGTSVATGFAYDAGQLDQFAFSLVSPTTYAFRDLTTGAKFTGTISGGPIAQVTFLRANGGPNAPSNGQDLKFDNLTILAPKGEPPVIGSEPPFGGGLVGSTIDLTGSASGPGPITYQWYYNNTPIRGATTSTFAIGDASLTNSGSYYFVASNAFGTVTSAVSVVTVYVTDSRLFAYEGFDYTGGYTAIDGVSQDGGIGWSNAWLNVAGDNNFIQDGSLVGGTNVPPGYDALSIGNSYYNFDQSRAGRWLDCSTNGVLAARGYINSAGDIGTAGKTIYISFMMQPDTASSFYEFELHRGDLGDPGRIAGIGNDQGTNTDVYFRTPGGAFEDMGAGDSVEDPAVGNHVVDFYVVRIDFQGGNDNVRVYRNPTSLTEPAVATLSLTNIGNMSFNGISLGCYGNMLSIDEIRLGGTWADALGMAGANDMLQPIRQGNGWNVQFAGNPSFTYHVLRANALTGIWTDLGTATPAESGIGTFYDANPPAGEAFYQTVTP